MNHEIRLFDVIGAQGMTAKDIAASIPADVEEITVRINSPGGAVSDGLAIYNYLRDHKASVTTIVDGYAASAASIVMLAGDVRKVHESSIVVIHNPWTISSGDSRDMRKSADVLDELQTALIGIYTDRTGITEDELRPMLDSETWMRGPIALDWGFASEVIKYEDQEENKQAASVHFGRMLEILNGGNELMSKQETRKEIEAKAAEAALKADQEKAEIEAKLTQEAEAKAALEAEHVAKVTDLQAKIDEVQAVVESLTVERDEAVAKIAEVEASLIEAQDAIKAEQEAKAEIEAAKDKAEAALKNPAVADANINTPNGVPSAQLDAEADEAEQAAIEAKAEAQPKDVAEEWEAMEAGQARVDFWNKNKKNIMAIIGAR